MLIGLQKHKASNASCWRQCCAGQACSNSFNQLPNEWNKDTHLLEDSSELCVVVVLEVERVGDVEVEGRGQQQQERRGVHSASNERRLARLESEVGGPPVSSGGGGGAGGRATGDVTSASKGPQFDPVLTIYKQPP